MAGQTWDPPHKRKSTSDTAWTANDRDRCKYLRQKLGEYCWRWGGKTVGDREVEDTTRITTHRINYAGFIGLTESLWLCRWVFLWDSQQWEWDMSLTLSCIWDPFSPTWLSGPALWGLIQCLALLYLVRSYLVDMSVTPFFFSGRSRGGVDMGEESWMEQWKGGRRNFG